jgi:hypothetical protein
VRPEILENRPRGLKTAMQAGRNHPDGLLSFKDMYLMWDTKSKDSDVSLRDHLTQFHDYMDRADKPVPVFLAVAAVFHAGL